MINFDDYTNENIIEHNSKWPYIPDHMINNSKLNPIVTELFIRGRKLNFYCLYYTIIF